MTRKLEGKTALITGGTTGIGLATAKVFAEEGARVFVTGQNPATIEAARKELDGVAEVIRSDAGDAAAIGALFDRIGRVDVLFLNAAVLGGGTIEEMTEERFDELFRINVKGPWLALKAAASHMVDGGTIVLNGSINARLGMPGTSAYAASKAALRSLARTAASELAARNIRVNVLSPGPTDTGIIEKYYGDRAPAIKAQMAERIVMKRLGTNEEIARAALFLAGSDSSFMTGEEIVVDGGMTRV
jgi:NAD(P)-dependent dehydrogenase (short-subunit alcohol dehydrogenase family)